ncbi:MAG: OprO/OprP family phosphate-selective porin [Balneolia bacterium]|nr:OprO/OprP family phosphate-selective porin [Balneolia bacterium]
MMKSYYRYFALAVLMLFLGGESIQAQTVSRDLPDDDNRFPMLPYYSYGRGLGLTTPDSTYQLNIRFRMQNRVTYTDNLDNDSSVIGEVRRLRLRFDGFVGDPRFLYAIQLSFSPGDTGTLQEGQNLNVIRDAVFLYRANPRLNLGFGQTKLPGNRQRVNSSGALQLTDRSINNAVFTIDRDFGLFANYSNENPGRFSYSLRAAISDGDGRNTSQSNGLSAITGRVELMPFGSFLNNGTLFEGDLIREETPKLLLGGSYHYNASAQRSRGQLGSVLFEERDLRVLHLDAMLKYQGWAFMAAYMMRSADDPITRPLTGEPGERVVFAGQGYDLQASYLFPSNYEIIGRFSNQLPDSEIRAFEPERQQYTVGLTRYVWEHALKVQGELTYETRVLTDISNSDLLYLRFQIEIGI